MTVEVRELGLPGVFEITPRRFGDERGFFSETFNANAMADAGLAIDWVQDNHSYSSELHVLRGMHYQLPPFAQKKLVRVCRGRVFDVVADIRKNSKTFGRWVGVELSAENWKQLLVPEGFAHGFVTLAPDTEFLYKVSAPYNADLDRSIKFDDPDLSIEWPLEGSEPILSDKDQSAPLLKDADLPETW